MSWSDFEIPQFFIIENSKHHMNFNTGYDFYDYKSDFLGVIVVPSNKLRKIGQINCFGFVVQKLFQCNFVKNC